MYCIKAPRSWLVLTFSLLKLLSIFEPKQASSNETKIRDKIMDHIFKVKNYNIHERPIDNQVTEVIVYIKVLSINSVDVRNMEYTTDIYLRQEWNDPRLAWFNNANFSKYDENIVSPKLKDLIWLPDLFFRNGKKGYLHKMTQPNYLMRLKPSGDILYSQKITMRFSCQMNLKTFPMDSQICYMNIGSYGYTLQELKFVWRKKSPITLQAGMQISEFNNIQKIDDVDCNKGAKTATGAYSCLKAKIHLERQLGSYLASTYVPNSLIIMVSWLNFWVSIEAVPARITLGLLTLLGILTQASSISTSLPRVSYIKAIDIWTIACIMFVISALIEFAIASTLARRQKSTQWHKEVRNIVRQELARWCAACQQQQLSQMHGNSHALNNTSQMEFSEELETLLTSQVVDERKDKKITKSPNSADSEIDSYSRFLFPACFILYNCFYWLYYLVVVHYINDENRDG